MDDFKGNVIIYVLPEKYRVQLLWGSFRGKSMHGTLMPLLGGGGVG